MSDACLPCEACGSACGRVVTPAGVRCRECADKMGRDRRTGPR